MKESDLIDGDVFMAPLAAAAHFDASALQFTGREYGAFFGKNQPASTHVASVRFFRAGLVGHLDPHR